MTDDEKNAWKKWQEEWLARLAEVRNEMNRAVARRDTSHGADIAKIDIEALTLEIKKLKELVSFANDKLFEQPAW